MKAVTEHSVPKVAGPIAYGLTALFSLHVLDAASIPVRCCDYQFGYRQSIEHRD
jgi:hypothetical protein